MTGYDATRFLASPTENLAGDLAVALRDGYEPAKLRALDSALIYRTLHEISEGTYASCLDEAIGIDTFLDSVAGRVFRSKEPTTAGGWAMLAEVLEQAAHWKELDEAEANEPKPSRWRSYCYRIYHAVRDKIRPRG